MAQSKGSGTINGAGDHGIMLTADDAEKGAAADTYRINIWNKSNGGKIYDNGVKQNLGGGSIAIHSK
jgi:hypothetical protein